MTNEANSTFGVLQTFYLAARHSYRSCPYTMYYIFQTHGSSFHNLHRVKAFFHLAEISRLPEPGLVQCMFYTGMWRSQFSAQPVHALITFSSLL